jgi:Ca2+-dependent lipid-binding protein
LAIIPNLFFEVSRVNEAFGLNLIYRSEVVRNTFKPVWNEVKLSMASMCNHDRKCPLVFELFDWDESGNHVSQGKVTVSVSKLLKAEGKVYRIMNSYKAMVVGQMSVMNCTLEVEEKNIAY